MSGAHEERTVGTGYRRWLIHPAFVSVGGSLLIAAFPSDLMYVQTSLMQWANASSWLIAAGLILALVAVFGLIFDVASGRGRINWLDFAILAVAVLVSVVNAFVHTRDAWTSVVPEGIWLSAIAAILCIIEAFRGWTVTTAPVVQVGDRA